MATKEQATTGNRVIEEPPGQSGPGRRLTTDELPPFWSLTPADLFARLQATPQGLTGDEAQRRLANARAQRHLALQVPHGPALLLRQFTSPITLILLVAAVVSLFLQDVTDAVIILVIVVASGVLSFFQERGADDAVAKLLASVQVHTTVLRDRQAQEVPSDAVVPGDVIAVRAGDIIAGDAYLLEAQDLFADEAALTGETYPVEKAVRVLPPATALAQRTNTLFRGTHVVSGRGTALVAATGAQTAFGQVSARLRTRAPENDFERGIRHFGYFLTEITMVLVLLIFAINVYFKRPVLESLLFAVALAVGLTPQLLPAVISINLAYGAKRMATKKVIVKRPDAIENFGSMDVLCSDKTGTLTEGIVTMHSAVGIDGSASERVLLYAYLNASFQTGLADPIDDAVRGYRTLDISAYTKQGEVPYDFVRKRLSVLVAHDGQYVLVTKGAVANVLAVCTTAEVAPGQVVALDAARADIDRRYEEFSGQGCRTLGVAYRPVSGATVSRDDESDLTFMGFIVLFDPPKPGIAQTIADLHALGIALKLITGDNRLVAAQVGREVGLAPTPMLTGLDLAHLSMEALVRQVPAVNIFAEIEPNQKERLLLALRKAGHVVGYIGDGINDAAALHAADVGISVDSAVDVAKEAAAIVLLDKDLSVLATGVREGRVTFANTLKYVFMATSANFGNMFSMAGASLFLSFLPLLPKQILLTNLLTDVPETTICTDSVDAELVARPRRWNIRFIRAFMLTFGLLSSVFDYLTFGVLFWLLHANAVQFRTGWFLESVTSATLIVLVIRSERPFFRSQPSRQLLTATLVIVAITLLLPYTTLARVLGFTALPVQFLVLMALIVALYVAAAETTKHLFYQRMHP